MEKICEVTDEQLQEWIVAAESAGAVIENPMYGNGCPVNVASKMVEKALELSCGKGVMCRDGLRQIAMILRDTTNGKGTTEDVEMMTELLGVIKECADCQLSETVAKQILKLIENYPDDWRIHVTRKQCKYDACSGCTKPAAAPVAQAEGTRRRRRR